MDSVGLEFLVRRDRTAQRLLPVQKIFMVYAVQKSVYKTIVGAVVFGPASFFIEWLHIQTGADVMTFASSFLLLCSNFSYPLNHASSLRLYTDFPKL